MTTNPENVLVMWPAMNFPLILWSQLQLGLPISIGKVVKLMQNLYTRRRVNSFFNHCIFRCLRKDAQEAVQNVICMINLLMCYNPKQENNNKSSN